MHYCLVAVKCSANHKILNMDRNEIILKSCKTIQRELNRLNKMKCTLDLAGHTFTCFDNTKDIKIDKNYNDGTNLNFDNQIVYEFTQHCT